MNPEQKRIFNIDEAKYIPFLAPPPEELSETFGAQFCYVAAQVGAKQLGYNITLVEPGKRAFPFHSHRVNEEMFFVIEGVGEIRIGENTFPIRQGDIIACPAGGPENAHQIINTSDAPLSYLAISTKLSPDIAEYPDSGKTGVQGQFPSLDGKTETLRFLVRNDDKKTDTASYWENEG